MVKNIFKTLLLIARPAAGKSEIIHFLKGTPHEVRAKRFHIGNFEEIDDFPMLWTWFEEDALLTRMGKPRLHTTPDGYFKEDYLWNLLIERISLEYKKKLRDSAPETIIIEFSRGSEHGGYRNAFAHLSDEILEHLAILYINVPWEESLRKNQMRFNPERPDSILEHGLPDEKLRKLYRDVDWDEIIKDKDGYLDIGKHQVPYAVFENADDVTTNPGKVLEERLETALNELWQRHQNR
jgi:hypothetical protein